MLTRSWYALLALRMRVSMSAIGSVIVMGLTPFLAVVPGGLWRLGPACDACSMVPGRIGPGERRLREFQPVLTGLSLRSRVDYQLDLVTPGSSPRCAICRRQMRHRPNARKTARGRPQRWQRV